MEVSILDLKIGTRKSNLAQVQADYIIALIKEKYDLVAEKLLVETEGDMKLDVSLDKIGGKGLFVKDIEIALLKGEAVAAVHSMKDVPYEISSEFEIIAMPIREDVRDAFISFDGVKFNDLPLGAKIGTSSLRRSTQIKKYRPDIETVPVRGNVETRIRKMKEENLNGIILASAGLKRLGLQDIITDYLDPFKFIPAVGQGALGIEVVKGSESSYIFKSFDNNEVRICVEAERSFMRKLNGGCHTSIGALAVIEGDEMFITGIYEVNGKLVKKELRGNKLDHIKLGVMLGEEILKG